MRLERKNKTREQQVLAIIGTLLLAEVYQLFVHFMGWIPAQTIGVALLGGLTAWALFFGIALTIKALYWHVVGDAVLLMFGGGVFWIAMQIWSISTSATFWWLPLLAVPYFILGQVAKGITNWHIVSNAQ